MEDLKLVTDVAIVPLPAGSAIGRAGDSKAAASASPAGRGFMKGSFTAVRTYIQITHNDSSLIWLELYACAQFQQTECC